jgi:hypothetical protein
LVQCEPDLISPLEKMEFAFHLSEVFG